MDYNNINWDEAVKKDLADYDKAKAEGYTGRSEIDLTKYFTLALPQGINTGERVFRILPLNMENPGVYYELVKFHNLKIGSKWSKLYDPAQDGDESPLNDVYQGLTKTAGKTAAEIKEDKALAASYKSRDFYIVRGIERGKEHEGVKFWRFNKVGDGTGVMDKLAPLMRRLNDKKPGSGAIWRPDGEGRDIVITLVRDLAKKYTKVSQIMLDDPTVLSDDENVATAWLTDTTVWSDLFRKKPIEYLRLVAEGYEPVWDKEAKAFVAKKDEDGETHTSPVETAPYEEPETEPEAEIATEAETVVATEATVEHVTITADDLPF